MNEPAFRTILIGTGHPPFEHNDGLFQEPFDWRGRISGLRGEIEIILFGEWEKIITPSEVRSLLLNLYANPQPPRVSVIL